MKLCTSWYVFMCALRKCGRQLCQNCVTYPPETLVKNVIYGDTPTRIDVAELVDRKVCWKDLACVSTRVGSRFPGVLDRPLRHLSV